MKITSLVGNYIFDKFGLMTKKTIARKSSQIGDEVVKIVGQKHTLEPYEMQSILNGILGKHGDAVDLVTDKAKTVEQLVKRANMPQGQAAMFYDCSKSLVLPSNNSDGILLNLRLDKMQDEELVNVASHECRHALSFAFSFGKKLNKILMQVPFCKNKLQQLSDKWSPLANEKNILCQQFIISKSKVPTEYGLTDLANTKEAFIEKYAKGDIAKFRNDIKVGLNRIGFFAPANYKQNTIIADAVQGALKEETEAYKIGAQAERAFYKAQEIDTKGRATVSDIRFRFYDEYVKVLKKEEKANFIKWIKSKFNFNKHLQ